jgi:uncharacterized membrane protein
MAFFLEHSERFVITFVAFWALLGVLLIILGILLAAYAQQQRQERR